MYEQRVNEEWFMQRFLKNYNKYDVIFEEGSHGEEMYLIHTGRVALTKQQADGKAVTLTVLKPGDFFGEMALVDDALGSATAIAVEGTQLITLDRTNFLFTVQQQPQFALSVMDTFWQRLRSLDEKVSASGGVS